MKIIECPRDAMQGLHEFIPTKAKADYINQLLKVGFDTIDFGSFVSPKAIPQLKDTVEVLKQLDISHTNSKLLAIVANLRGAQAAVQYDEIAYVGFPLSISETFQQRNTNKSIPEAMDQLREIQNLCKKSNKILVTYISMGFGNPYGEPFDEDIVAGFTQKLSDMEVGIVSLADTIGVAKPSVVQRIFIHVIKAFPTLEIGAHFHSNPNTAIEKVKAAYEAGCRRFDTAIKGFGGCPMAKDELVGNVATETLVSYFETTGVNLDLEKQALEKAVVMANSVFPQ